MKRVEISNLSFRHRKRDALILDQIRLEVGESEILSILGPNGAGKSTLLHCLLGLAHPESGAIRLCGTNISSLSRLEIARRIAYVPQFTQSAFAFTVAQMVLMGRTAYIDRLGSPSSADREIADCAIEEIGISHLRLKPFTQLSGGERQLVLIARAVAQDAPIIVMDEPTASLDLGNQGRVLGLMRKLAAAGKSLIMTTHLPDQAFNLKSRAGLLKSGRLVALGPVRDVCTLEAMSELYGARLLRLSDDGGDGLAAYLPALV